MISIFSTSHCKKKGFTLVELLVSLGIMVTILTLVLSNQSKYTEGTALTGLADDISLDLLQAQTYGVSVREFAPGTEEFDAAYGVSLNLIPQGGNSTYIYFADRGVKNKIYDSGLTCPIDASSECIKKNTVLRGNVISGLCYILKNGQEQCNLGRIDITYLRPDTKANIIFFGQNGSVLNTPNAIAARINIASPSRATRSIYVYKSGQISVR